MIILTSSLAIVFQSLEGLIDNKGRLVPDKFVFSLENASVR